MIESFLDMHPQALYELVFSGIAFVIAMVFFLIGILFGWILCYIRLKKRLPARIKQKLADQAETIKQQNEDLFYMADDNTHMRAALDGHASISKDWIAGNIGEPLKNIQQIKIAK